MDEAEPDVVKQGGQEGTPLESLGELSGVPEHTTEQTISTPMPIRNQYDLSQSTAVEDV